MILKFREAHIGNMEKGRKGEVRGGEMKGGELKGGEVRGGVQAGRETLRGDGEGRKRKPAPSPTSEDTTPEAKEPSIVRNTLIIHTHLTTPITYLCRLSCTRR